MNLGGLYHGVLNFEQARQYFERSLVFSRAQNNPIHLAEGLILVATLKSGRRHGTERVAEAQAIFRPHGDWMGVLYALAELARLAIWEGEYPLAQRCLNDIENLLSRGGRSDRIRARQCELGGRLAFWAGDLIEHASIWKKAPDEDDFKAAYAYLSLLVSPAKARALVKDLRSRAEVRIFEDLSRRSAMGGVN